MRVLKECNRESFYQRSLPLGTLLGLGTFYAVKSGYFRTSARWGATPKVIVAAVTGYFFGKLSYQKTCAEKMMALPNSPLGETLRRRRQQAGGMASSFSETARWGATPKVIVAAVTGYFFGKLSYQKTCAEKMMALPNSPLGETLRRRRQQAGGMASSFSET
ncbi:hypothetical protein B566_EDAN018311 [Ephemera danica]|nr:hypothetical protein B566_EDAN018311 [Ephemera danica]